MKSRKGIYYNLKLSEYRHEVDGLTFVFSSQLHLDKFKERLKENRDIINYSLSRRFNIPVSVNQLADIVLYKRTETRGFFVMTNEGIEICQEKEMIYQGGKVRQN